MGLAAVRRGILMPAGCFQGGSFFALLGPQGKKNLAQLALSFVSVTAFVCNHGA